MNHQDVISIPPDDTEDYPFSMLTALPRLVEIIRYDMLQTHGLANVLAWMDKAQEEALEWPTLREIQRATPRFIAIVPKEGDARNIMEDSKSQLLKHGASVFDEMDPDLQRFMSEFEEWERQGKNVQIEPAPAEPPSRLGDQRGIQLSPQHAQMHVKLLQFINRQHEAADDYDQD